MCESSQHPQPEIRKRRSGHFRNHALAVFASRTCALPDGRHVQYVSKPDVAFLYHAFYDKQAYLQHGVLLHPGNTVLDVERTSACLQTMPLKRLESKGVS